MNFFFYNSMSPDRAAKSSLHKAFPKPFVNLLFRLVNFLRKNLKTLQLVVLIMEIFNSLFAAFYYGCGNFYCEHVIIKSLLREKQTGHPCLKGFM